MPNKSPRKRPDNVMIFCATEGCGHPQSIHWAFGENEGCYDSCVCTKFRRTGDQPLSGLTPGGSCRTEKPAKVHSLSERDKETLRNASQKNSSTATAREELTEMLQAKFEPYLRDMGVWELADDMVKLAVDTIVDGNWTKSHE
jgi:hypothetical protein